ncbi:MAG TPA: 3-isopropylmalate dehydratase small subunit [Candidatus Limnocylindria bacterium]|nr:3-isopropylmalate dehydratase small subunit [Candidatus Limnocylindria bacterium]
MTAAFTSVRSAVVPLLRDDVDTDQIIPARYLKAVTRDGLAEGLFADWRYDSSGAPRSDFILNDSAMAGRAILLAGSNFGCGSSREHAPWALAGNGFRAVIAGSFADIFRNNALKNGLLPVALGTDALARVRALLESEPTAQLEVDLEAQEVRLPDGSALSFEIDPFARSMLLAGTDELGYLLSLSDEMTAYDDAHPRSINTLAR